MWRISVSGLSGCLRRSQPRTSPNAYGDQTAEVNIDPSDSLISTFVLFQDLLCGYFPQYRSGSHCPSLSRRASRVSATFLRGNSQCLSRIQSTVSAVTADREITGKNLSLGFSNLQFTSCSIASSIDRRLSSENINRLVSMFTCHSRSTSTD